MNTTIERLNLISDNIDPTMASDDTGEFVYYEDHVVVVDNLIDYYERMIEEILDEANDWKDYVEIDTAPYGIVAALEKAITKYKRKRGI